MCQHAGSAAYKQTVKVFAKEDFCSEWWGLVVSTCGF